MTQADEHHLRRAVELAAAARAAGDMPFGSLLVGPTGDVLAEERNTVARQTTMYTSCEPCPMCRGAIARSGLGRVVFALPGEQSQELRPPGAVSPDAAHVAYEGPALFAEARVPIDCYYD
jgi:tRNA(Arg) A34 adenosine deaminase TadA